MKEYLFEDEPLVLTRDGWKHKKKLCEGRINCICGCDFCVHDHGWEGI